MEVLRPKSSILLKELKESGTLTFIVQIKSKSLKEIHDFYRSWKQTKYYKTWKQKNKDRLKSAVSNDQSLPE
jgi:hypothetical protein